MKVAVLITTHNNVETCLKALLSLDAALEFCGFQATVFLANSGTSSILGKGDFENLQVEEIRTSSDVYWAAGMRIAWELIERKRVKHDLVLWLNDDTMLFQDSLYRLSAALAGSGPGKIAVGSTRSSEGRLTYGGYRQKHAFLPLHLEVIEPMNANQVCDAFNGNVVLMGIELIRSLGGFPRGYSHLRADYDFSFSAKRRGYVNVLISGYVAECEANHNYVTYKSMAGTKLGERFKKLQDPKLGPFYEHVRFSLRNGGILGPVYALAPIVRVLAAI
jgi:GT2 family glycosyltransferase